MTGMKMLELLPEHLRDLSVYGNWDWIYYPEKRLQTDRFLISTEGKIYDVVRCKEISGNFMGEARVKYAPVYDEIGEPIKISVAKALLYTFLGTPPNGKSTTKIKFLDCDRRNVVLTNVRWAV